ncbi:PepSY domain-containing protein [Siccirubricoccus sp. KC 17139]|uniref:PepSY domain-containing protein n=1 Tax=Siccirubricoccus soli TaxID=2899147 RepID=A0ABT1DAJ2_9PROT|nr:PepSY-associated TM helix domain-containing protein [Siccirubricoccus soli]MCO6418963.1 PepSY domain-containing protein [Siccirubricoccus soli]MCP2685098.1 PepSY domain-containing protein [Siccirubricoccus soli]
MSATAARGPGTVHRILLLTHRWAGILLGLVMLLLGITGSVLSFQREIEAALHPALFRPSGPPNPDLGYAEMLTRAEAALRAPVGTLRPPDAVWPVWTAQPQRMRGGGGGGGAAAAPGAPGGNAAGAPRSAGSSDAPGGGVAGAPRGAASSDVPGGGAAGAPRGAASSDVPGGGAAGAPRGAAPSDAPGGDAAGAPRSTASADAPGSTSGAGRAAASGGAPGGGTPAGSPGRPGAGAPAGNSFETVYLDPATGALLGRRDPRGGFVSINRQLHESLMLREWGGRDAVGWFGVLLLIFCLSGIWLWWPRGPLLPALVQFRRRPALILQLDLHRLVGIWMAVVLTVVAISGVVIVFPAWFRPLLGVAAPTPPAAAAPRREPMRIDADAAVAAALAHLPGQAVTGLTPPSRQRPAWNVTLRPADGDAEVRVRSSVSIDPWEGTVLEERGPRTRSLGEELIAMQRWLHGGQLLGWTGRILVFLSGIAMPVLFVTGLAAWLLRRRNLRRTAARRRAIQANVSSVGAGAD